MDLDSVVLDAVSPRSSPTSHGSGAEDLNGGFSYEGVSSHEYLFYDYATDDGHAESAYKNYKQGPFQGWEFGVRSNWQCRLIIRSYYNGSGLGRLTSRE